MSWKAHVDGSHYGEEHLLYMKRRVEILRVMLLIICLVYLDFAPLSV